MAVDDESGNVYSSDPVPDLPTHSNLIEPIYMKGTSRRIFGELYKVIDSSDVIVHVLDARDPLGTKCDSVINYLKKEKAHKQIIFVLNKCDLIPTWATVSIFSFLGGSIPLFRSFLVSRILLRSFEPHVPSQVSSPLIYMRPTQASETVTAMGEQPSAFLFSITRYVCFGAQERAVLDVSSELWTSAAPSLHDFQGVHVVLGQTFLFRF